MAEPRKGALSWMGYIGLGIGLVLFGAISFGLLSSGWSATPRAVLLGLLGIPLGAVAIVVGVVKRSGG